MGDDNNKPDIDVSSAVKQWRSKARYLPSVLKDFHDAKDVFASIEFYYGRSKDFPVDWVSGQVYVIDFFLWFMAAHGYTLQKCKTKLPFCDLQTTIEKRQAYEVTLTQRMLASIQAKKEEKDDPRDSSL